ncbi:hypothetical protein ACFOY4_01665 [Actinomadura syzygii]|uniref:hypothetical protein n=1 Tax=Actinomadura syzygii TaxID=1427538 RepID=UPI001651DD82|nr:hypothetical protein [Actinomadura syzygii]
MAASWMMEGQKLDAVQDEEIERLVTRGDLPSGGAIAEIPTRHTAAISVATGPGRLRTN